MTREIILTMVTDALKAIVPVKGETVTERFCVRDLPHDFQVKLWMRQFELLKSFEGRAIKSIQVVSGDECDQHEWIVKLVVELDGMNEERAREILGTAVMDDDSISEGGWPYMAWGPGDDDITLDSEFTVEQLEAIAWWMRNHSAVK